MQKEKVLQLINEKLAQVEEAEKKNALTGNLNFGLHLHLYRQSPYLKDFEKKRQLLHRFILLETFFIPLMVIGIDSNTFDKIAESPFTAILGIIAIAAVAGFFFVYFPLRMLIAFSNSTQKEVKKMMLHDLRQQVETLDDVSEMAAQKNVAGSF